MRFFAGFFQCDGIRVWQIIGVFPYWKTIGTIGTAETFGTELLPVERLEPLEQASLRCVQSDGGPRSAGQTENSFRQSQTILRDLKHHSLRTRRFERLERSAAVEPFDRLLEPAAVIGERPNRIFRFAIYRSSHYSPTLSTLDSNVKSKDVTHRRDAVQENEALTPGNTIP